MFMRLAQKLMFFVIMVRFIKVKNYYNYYNSFFLFCAGDIEEDEDDYEDDDEVIKSIIMPIFMTNNSI